MKLYRWLAPVTLLVGLALLAACKKNEDTTNEYLTGKLSLSMPAYVSPGYTKTFMIDSLMTMSRSDKGPVGYVFTDPDTEVPDTLVGPDGVIRNHYFTVTVPTKLATQTLKLTAIVPKDDPYYSSSVSASYTIVFPGIGKGTSITNVDINKLLYFTDIRDGNHYYYTLGGNNFWMRHNLAWAGAGKPFELCPAMTQVFGQYYTWEEAQTACPPGWRLPTDAEWTAFSDNVTPGTDVPGLAGKLMGDLYFNGTKMWEYWREVTITDDYGLSIMPVGYANVASGEYDFDGLYTYAVFWTADESDGLGVCRYIYHNKDVLYRGRLSKTEFAASVRCVLDLDD